MTRSQDNDHQPDHVDPDADPEMKQAVTQQDQAEGDDDAAETGSS